MLLVMLTSSWLAVGCCDHTPKTRAVIGCCEARRLENLTEEFRCKQDIKRITSPVPKFDFHDKTSLT